MWFKCYSLFVIRYFVPFAVQKKLLILQTKLKINDLTIMLKITL
jgi:hypothetical protein